jgi:hypothetical protein
MQRLPQHVAAQPERIIGIENRAGIGGVRLGRARQGAYRAAQRVECFAR